MSVTAHALPESAPMPAEGASWHTLIPQPIPEEAAQQSHKPSETPGSPSEAAARPTPAELFEAHVSAVRAGGDAIDTPRLRTIPRSVAYGVAATIGSAVATNPNVSAMVIEWGVTTTVMASFLGRAVLKSKKANIGMAHDRLNDATQAKVNAYYELYALKSTHEDGSNRMAMRWYGPRSNEEGKSGGELLHTIASLAKDNGIDELILSRELAEQTVETGITQPGESTTTYKWLSTEKRMGALGKPLVSGTRKGEDIQVATPDQWIDYAIEGNPHESTLALQNLLRRLQNTQPDHPAVTTAALYTDPAQRSKHVAHVLRTSMQRQVEEKLPPAMNIKRGDPQRARQQGRFVDLSNEKVNIYNNGVPEAQTTLDRALQIYSPADLARMHDQLESPGAGYAKTRILEYALYKTALTGISPFAVLQSEKDPQKTAAMKAPGLPHMVQRELGAGVLPKEKKERLNQTQAKQFRATIAMGGIVAGLAVTLGIQTVDERYDAVRERAEKNIILEHGAQPGRTDVDKKLIDKRLGEWSRLNTAWGGWQQARENVQEKSMDALAAAHEKIVAMWPGTPPQLPFHMDISSGVASGGTSKIGNVPPGHEADPIWHVAPYGDIDPTGLWLEGTSSRLQGEPAHWGAGMEASWDTLSYIDNEGTISGDMYTVPTQPLASEDGITKPYLELSRTVSETDFIFGAGRGYMPLPVKDGMMPISVSTDLPSSMTDNESFVKQAPDGTYYYVLPKHRKIHVPSVVTYRIAPTKDAMATIQPGDVQAKPMAVKSASVEINGGMALSQDRHEISEIQNILIKSVPGYQEAGNDSQRRHILANYLSENFGYDTQPLSKSDLKHIKNWADYVRIVMKNQEANCNVASTLVAVSTHTPVAVGFLNKPGKDQDTLQVGEAHMINIDEAGPFDPTPSNKKITTATQPQGPVQPLVPWQAVAGMLVAAGAIAASRKNVRSKAGQLAHAVAAKTETMAVDRAQKELDDTHISVLLATAAAAGQLLYGRDGLDPQKLLHMATNSGVSREQAEHYIARPHVYASETQKLFKQHHEQVTPSMRRTARLAGRIARRRR